MNNLIYALGFFDGVHVGHQALLAQCRSLAGENGLDTGAVTFRSHPDALVFGAPPVLINTPADRERLLGRYVRRVVTLPFDRQMQDTPWQDFLALLRREYHAAGFVCGDDFRFGRQGRGNGALLADYCREQGLPWAVVPEQTLEGIRVSSTHIRTLLERGDVSQANRFLGHSHILTGQVVHGQQLGRTLGIPTANLPYPDGLVVPKSGVYATRICIDGISHPAVTNVGTRPTVSGHSRNVESWILDYSGDLYGRELTVEFYQFLRPERKFDSLEQMQQEIHRNARQTRAYFAELAYSLPTRYNSRKTV